MKLHTTDGLLKITQVPLHILISDDDPFGRDLVTYIKDSYETLFAKDGVKRLVIEVREMAAEQLKSETAAWNFDLTLK